MILNQAAEMDSGKHSSNKIIYFQIFLIVILISPFIKPQDKNTHFYPYLSLEEIFRLHPSINDQVRKNIRNSFLLSSQQTQNISAKPDLTLFGNIGNNFLDSFKGDNLYLHLAGIASSYFLITQNVDYHVEDFFNKHEQYGQWARPILFTGELLPFIAGGSLYAYAKAKNDDEVLGASFAVMQASILEFLYNSALKAITGRAHPDWRHSSDMKSLSKEFRFGFMRGGIFWGWPSGHTAATMAVVSALTNYYPHSTWLKIVGYSLVAYTIFGVSSVNRGGMHWFSDAIAASFMSYAVGSTVGKYYRRVYNSGSSTGQTSNAVISPGFNPMGISFVFNF